MPLCVIGVRRFMAERKLLPLWSCNACILEATRQTRDVNHTEVQGNRFRPIADRGAVSEAAYLPRKVGDWTPLRLSPTTNAGRLGKRSAT